MMATNLKELVSSFAIAMRARSDRRYIGSNDDKSIAEEFWREFIGWEMAHTCMQTTVTDEQLIKSFEAKLAEKPAEYLTGQTVYQVTQDELISFCRVFHFDASGEKND